MYSKYLHLFIYSLCTCKSALLLKKHIKALSGKGLDFLTLGDVDLVS